MGSSRELSPQPVPDSRTPFRVLDLFSGIGGFSLGLERAGGFQTVAFCEIEEFPRRVLAKHWPGVPIYDDVRTLTADRLRADGIAVDVICGGFPCQDISQAGRGAGMAGARSGLWSEMHRLTSELRPRYVIVENVAALLGRGLDRVLGDLAEIGFDAEWHCIPASAVGAPHIRDRLWLIAYPQHPDADSFGSHQAALHEHGSAELRDEQEREPRPLAGWGAPPPLPWVVDGVPDELDVAHVRAFGNSLVPRIPELIGRAISSAKPIEGRGPGMNTLPQPLEVLERG